ncbi:ABC transporter substrate-binding protein [Nesterenkonia sp. NBAIMH1]|uniref:ABC transporter substrate-binding protein n=1 Tax=Nesterenkonia sp. NBAIMH1 TaxID=2600320 RepID=UPI0011B391A7|nr:ABC transporter substrate-binding protein [Nesterenkonia sp. NBAIMH1]
MNNARFQPEEDTLLRRRCLPGTLKAAGVLSIAALTLSACGNGGEAEADPDTAEGDTAQAAQEPPEDGVLRLGVLDDIGQPPDPDIYYSGNGLALTTNLYEGLVRYEPGNHDEATVIPLLAEEWEINDEFTEFTFQLREGVTFHDGAEFNAEAVEASFQRRLDVDAGPAYMAAGVDVQAEDEYTVTMVLEEPNSAFLDYLASPYGPRMISPEVIEEHDEDNAEGYIAENSAGTGPYTLAEASVGDGYTLEAFEDYWDEDLADPEFHTIDLPVYTEISAMQLELEQGDLHALLQGVPSSSRGDYMDDEALSAFALPSYQLSNFLMNPNREILSDPEARVALFEGIDWNQYTEDILGDSAVPATGDFPQGALPDYEDRELTHSPEALAEWAAENEGEEIVIGHSSASTDSEQMANLVAAELQGMGLNATVTSHQSSEIFGDFYEDATASPDAFVYSGTWPDSNNPYMHGHVFWGESGGLNHLRCSNEEIDELLDEALVTDDAETFNEAGEAAYEYGCAPTFAWVSDFMVFQPWISGVEEAHSIAAPATVDFARLSVDE